ncbi:BnaC05g32800D [Brassica napus]|uniref:BnaC05g32800D protein n=1 Tax=Brassica napus TaxID=3708 RepID=A0A078GGW3_BRANA|nr:BnaC05g32800D [Brassica napus]
MDDETLNLYDDDDDEYLSGNEMMNQNEDGHDSVQDDSASAAGNRGRRRRNKRRHSKCWKHFEIVGDKFPDGTTKVICKHCEYSYFIDLSNGTNTLLRHSRVCSKNPGSTPRSRKFDIMDFREMIAGAIVEHDLAYSFVEFRRIREAFEYANPSIEFWCRNTVVSDVHKIYENEKAGLRKVLSEVPGRICFTTDLWRAITVEGYLCLTAHYVDNWKLKAKILSFCAFPPPHTGYSIAMKVMELVKEWGLEKKVFIVTVDNASSNDNMQGVLKTQLRRALVCNGEFLHVRCAAHFLNLIV